MAVIVKSAPQILHAIVGTAGHVDHGKTSLVKLLTGCETDRLPEEKARGMSIDLGFAPCLLQGRRLVGIVDVPGHKDFIRNMVAGAASIDVLLLVVAADDGVMPQTDEHMKIVRLLRSPQVMVALTKIDMVSPDMLELARQDVAAFLDRVGFGGAPIIPVSNKTGDGISDIRDAIDALVERVQQSGPDPRAFRMNVERVFSVKGYGTVLTGIPVSGQLRVGERVELLPAGKQFTVRTIQSYKQDSETAFANCCCAINLREIEAEKVTRGMTLALPGIYRATTELVASITNATDGHVLKRRFEARLHAGTSVVDASIKLLGDDQQVLPGREAFVHIVLSEPIVLAASDRFILRAPSPADTIGGGVVLSARPQRLRRHAELLPRLQPAQEATTAGDGLSSELLAGPDAILTADEVKRLSQRETADAPASIEQAISRGLLADLGGAAYGVIARAGEPAQSLAAVLERYHRANPYSWGMTQNHVCETFGLAPKNFAGLARFLNHGADRFTLKHGRLALTSFKPALSERLLTLRDQILQQIDSAGVNGLARGNLMKELSIVERDMHILAKLLTEDGSVLMLDGNFVLRCAFGACRQKLLELFTEQSTVDLNRFRDTIGSNRKLAVAMLDAFDAEGLTRRVADGRVLVTHHEATSAIKEVHQ